MKKEIPPAWGTIYDKFGDHSGAFIASREGLVYLRDKIDEALKNGEAEIGSDADFDFVKIEVKDIHPTLALEPQPVLNRVMGFVLMSFIAIFIMLALYGCHSLLDLIRK